MTKYALFFLAALTATVGKAQQPQSWNGKQCAVVLTYDDAIDADLDRVVPALDSVGLKGTFYLIGNSPVIANRMPEWRAAAAHGHELANHTSFHPCDAQRPGRSFVTPETDLSRYTIRRAVEEIRLTNTLLHAIDGKTERTFAFPCGDLKIGDSFYYPAVSNQFVAARGVGASMPSIDSVDLSNVPCYGMYGQSGDEMIALVKKAQEKHALLVFLFHGVGGGHNINEPLADHDKLLQYLKAHEKEIWIAPMVDVAKFIRIHQQMPR